jgi:hypothetical protein
MLLLEFLDLNSGVNNVSDRSLEIEGLLIELSLAWDGRGLSCLRCITFPVHQNLKVLVEFF